MHRGFSELDGFFTFLMGTDKEMLIVRDAFACKPAVVAETDDYVAIASEFRSLAHLPGVGTPTSSSPNPKRCTRGRRETLRSGGDAAARGQSLLHRDAVSAGVKRVKILNADGAHSIAAGLAAPLEVEIDGHAGYYAGA